jgi:hypothetical protein
MPPLLTVLRGAQLPLAAGEKEMLGSRCDRFTQRLRGMGISLHHYSATNAGSPRRLRPERAGRVYYGAVFPRSKEEIPNKSSAFWLSDDAFNEILCSMVIEDSRERKECAMQDHGDMSTARSLDSEIHGVSVVSGARGSGAARNGSSSRMVVRPAEPGGGGTLTWRMKVFQFCSRAT